MDSGLDFLYYLGLMGKNRTLFGGVLMLMILWSSPCQGEQGERNENLDDQVESFLKERAGQWKDLNIPAADGRLLHDLILENGYTKALEIGTSTGHSSIWIAWALSKTGGKLVTIEIDPSRHRQAKENFQKAGLSEYIDARLGDAHELVKELEGPFDFVFSDADKGWYKNYFMEIDPKLEVNGCFTAHNITGSRGYWGTGEFFDYVRNLPGYETSLNRSGAGVSISFKRSTQQERE